MNRILITGATGNVGKEVIRHLLSQPGTHKVMAGVRNLQKDSEQFNDSRIEFLPFDFEDPGTFESALSNCDVLFLLRPPQLANVKKQFAPLIETAKRKVKHIVFLSVQGVQNSPMIPHYKIEKAIVESGLSYTFLRPAYFMQNLTATLRKDIVENRRIFLPAGEAKFTVVDTGDIGAVTAVVLTNPALHRNKVYDLTNNEKLSFGKMAEKLTAVLETKITYVSPNPIRFFIQKRKEGLPVSFILVMIMLHYFPRFKKEPDIAPFVYQLTGRQPKSFDEFLKENKQLLA